MLYKFTISRYNLYIAMAKHKILYQFYESPYGKMCVGSIDGKICISDWTESRRHEANKRRLSEKLDAVFQFEECPETAGAIQELEEYFAGSRRSFTMPILLEGSRLQSSVRRELLKIPYGATATYAMIAALCGNPKAVRAVANAVASNPLSIIVPCHRVIGSSGSLTGYAGGLETKRCLLTLEKESRS